MSAQFAAVLDDVAERPPPRYSGGGRWEAMHGSMGGYHEVRAQGPGREQFRLFCILENGTPEEMTRRGLSHPTIAVITGMRKPWMTPFSEHDYEAVGRLGMIIAAGCRVAFASDRARIASGRRDEDEPTAFDKRAPLAHP